MRISVRTILVALGVAFTVYMVARGFAWTSPVPQPLIVVAGIVFYFLTTMICIFWEPRRSPDAPGEADGEHPHGGVDELLTVRTTEPDRLPVWAGVLALATAVIVPSAIAVAVGPESWTAPFATWYLGGIGLLMLVVVVRRRPWVAWSGIAALTIASMVWMGPMNALALGLVGSIVWVAVGQLTLVAMDRAARDTAELAQLQRAASVWQASQTGRQRERRIQVQRALTVAGPVLSRTVASGGMLTADEKLQARLAEGRLRDEMRGPRLLDDDVRSELERARRRGATVTVLDEGGLEGTDDESLSIIRRELAATLRTAGSDRLYIRTSPHDRVAVTVVGRSGSEPGLSEEDAVDLWREITHPGTD
ncbi:MAG: hypothetical protein ABWY37_09495 [Microbacterium pygmaeum]